MICNAVHNAFLNTLTTGTTFPRVPLEMKPVRNYTTISLSLRYYAVRSHWFVPFTYDKNTSSGLQCRPMAYMYNSLQSVNKAVLGPQ